MDMNHDLVGNTPEGAPIPALERRDNEYFADISGANSFGRPKARIMIRYYNAFSDGTEEELQSLVVEKPILSIFKHVGYVNVRMDFDQRIDQDLLEIWNMLEEYSDPINSVSYLEEEIESGYYVDADGRECMVYFPTIDLTISPITKEQEYVMLGINPAFYTLQPRDPAGDPTVLQFTFQEDFFYVNKTPHFDLESIQREVLRELGLPQSELS